MKIDNRLFTILKDRQEMSFAEIGEALGVSEQEAHLAVRHLITKKLFTGYVNWAEGIVYPRPDMTFEEATCPACGSVVKTTPRGTKKCAACGAELCFADAMSKRFLAAYDVDAIIGGSEGIEDLDESETERKEDKPEFPYMKVCGRCGAKVDIGGKLKTTCPYCGAEVF